MTDDQDIALRLSFLTSEEALRLPPASDILAQVRARPVWDLASIAPAEGQFPLLHIDWHEGRGFVLQCYQDEQSWSDFLTSGSECGVPTVEVELGGQALERWPAELFVPEDVARRAIEHFARFGTQDPALRWIRIDEFPRETIWEGREGREAWERANHLRDRDV